ncbi:hypothetical protein [Desulfoluna limicola]|uniref:hypothetical protein n=1 Tax=Desulfoluna limicola TaxID=2810562 RepID=UPI001F48499B|nr:hypothetical protein [Desulfoluna limicola]
MLNDPTVKKSIYASIIASIVVIIFIQPILNYAAMFFVWIGDMLYVGFSNQLYQEAALGLREKYSFSLFIMFIGFILLFFIVAPLITLILQNRDNTSNHEPSKLFIAFRLLNKVFLLTSAIFVLSLNFAGLQMNTSFNQRMRAIKPYITQNQYDKYQSKWALMSNRNDYDQINYFLENESNKFNIKLPKLLWD